MKISNVLRIVVCWFSCVVISHSLLLFLLVPFKHNKILSFSFSLEPIKILKPSYFILPNSHQITFLVLSQPMTLSLIILFLISKKYVYITSYLCKEHNAVQKSTMKRKKNKEEINYK